ncbi:MAG TPA: Holliday junction resolvase RuvX [Flavobacteriales bacterium]|nr:Holliday junction resolvase RuvX [Flavobacteriales bacterium]
MGRVLAIDHGRKRTGLAVTDPLRIIASALDTVPTAEVIAYLKAYLAREEVDGFVVGLPMGLDGRPTDATAGVEAFLKQLRKAFPGKWVETVDERFTSSLAKQAVLQSGIGRKARRDKAQLDRISATIILQDWLSRKAER